MAIEQAVWARICEAVETERMVMTEHAVDEMIADNLYEFDLEHCILTGDITETQWDDDFQEWKYVIEGKSTDGDDLAVVPG
jgi:3',5'-cyclic AMP phosphodiesterase CpdA